VWRYALKSKKEKKSKGDKKKKKDGKKEKKSKKSSKKQKTGAEGGIHTETFGSRGFLRETDKYDKEGEVGLYMCLQRVCTRVCRNVCTRVCTS
jgi:hypothetical protein